MTTEVDFQQQYRARKYRRFAEDAKHAPVIARYKAVGDDGQDCRITIKRAMRSQGYKSGYQPVLKFWCFMEQDGQPFYAFSMTEGAYNKWMRETIIPEPRWITC